MKKYNKPVVEINGFEVEDVIAVSGYASGYSNSEEIQAVYLDLTGKTEVDLNDQVGVYEW
ncbi:MAG: hypothetical protein K5768_06485 [Firmicutes bacterium]|nr:hypothetical protein [Bacillota bacterium]